MSYSLNIFEKESSIQTNTYRPKNEIFLRAQKILTAKP